MTEKEFQAYIEKLQSMSSEDVQRLLMRVLDRHIDAMENNPDLVMYVPEFLDEDLINSIFGDNLC